MYSKILVPLDGSSFSACILEHVKAIALGCSAQEVILLRVVEPADSILHTFYVPQELSSELKTADSKARAEAESYLAGVVSDLKKEGVEAKPVLLMAPKVDEEILDYASKNGVDLIIMSTHGKSGVSRWAFGSVADRVVRNSTVPVLMASPAGCRVNQD